MRALGRTMADLENDMWGSPIPLKRLVAAMALCYAGLCCEGFDGLLRRATRQLSRELDSQILPDGGHVSRNPRVLVELLLELLPLRQIYATRGIEPPKALVGAIDRMLPMLRLFRHGDGTLAHFNGMGLTAAHHLTTVLIYDDARAQAMQRASHSGYERLQAGASLITADVGAAPGPRDSGEAHAGCLSFEFSRGAHRVVVNCGVSSRGDGALKLVGRATAAHSTATVAETSSCRFLIPERWSLARSIAAWLQRRLGTIVLNGPTVVSAERNDNSQLIEIRASHDGYRARFGLTHERRWQLAASGEEFHGQDVFIPDGESTPARDVAIRFHLHPTVKATSLESGRVKLVLPNQEAWFFDANGAAVEVEESVFFPTSDRPRRSEQLVLSFSTAETRKVRWRFERVGPATP
jgi:uncharacterized heparinase superfamily protein